MVNEQKIFDVLVSSLKNEEKQHLLQRINSHIEERNEPKLGLDFPDDKSLLNIDKKYTSLSIFQKLAIWFTTFFKKVDFYDAVEKKLYSNLKEKLRFSPKKY